MAQQNLDFNIVAHTKGMEAIATLINRVGALEAETKRLTSANQSLSASTETVIRNGVRYNNAMDAQSKQLRQARQGTQQLGMQINDFATSVSSGTSVQQAFTQQLGQVGYAMSMMGGTAGRIGAFLAGPWGAAILIGAMALGPMISKLWETVTGAKAAAGALEGLARRRQAMVAKQMELPNAERELAALVAQRGKLEADIAKRGRRDSQGRLMFVYREQKELAKINEQIAAARADIDFGRTEKFNLGLDTVTRDLNAPQVAAQKAVGGGGGASSAKKTTEDAEKARERLAEIQRDLERIRYQDDQARAKSFAEMAIEQEKKLEETLANIQEMAVASVATLDEQFIKPFRDSMDELTKSYESIGNAVASSFQGMLSGAMSWKEGMKGIINSVINELWRLYVVQQIVGFVTDALGGLGLPMPKGKAVGGYVAAQTPYVVGERGPELFVPGGSGTIIPNKNMGMGGGSGGVTVNVDARGSADPAAVRAQVEAGILQAAPAIIAAAQNRTVSNLRRPRLGGAMQ